jgi:hypothetical protein
MGKLNDLMLLKHWREHPTEFWKVATAKRKHQLNIKEEIFLNDIKLLKYNRMMMCCGSGTGKTFNLGAVALWSALVLPPFIGQRYDVVIASGSINQSQKLYSYSREFLESHPVIENSIDGESTKTKVVLTNGTITALPASDKSLYSVHADLMIVDEAVEAGGEVLKHMYRIVGPSPYSRIILSSTPHNPQAGYTSQFVDMWENVANKYPDWQGKRGWKRYAWNWMDCPWISDEQLQEARAGYSEELFQVLCMGEPHPVIGTFFQMEDIRDHVRIDDRIRAASNSIIIIGVDWGYSPNPTAIVVVQYVGDEVHVIHTEAKTGVKFSDWNDRIEALYEQYTDMGNEVYVYSDASHIGENQRLKNEKHLPLSPIKFKAHKPRMLENIRYMVENGKIKIWQGYDELLRQLSRYVMNSKDNVDLLEALMLALYYRKGRTGSTRRNRFYIEMT